MDRRVKILLSIDALMDTRIATIASIDEELAVSVLSGNYYRRLSDFFPGVDKTQFDEKYASRGESADILARSLVSNCVVFLRQTVDKLITQAIETPYQSGVCITLNTYPYKIPQEIVNQLVSSLVLWTGEQASIDTVFISPEDLKPSLIKGRYDILIMYEYAQWLETHTEDFAYNPINTVNLYVPAISFNTDLTREMVADIIKKEKIHPLDELKFLSAPFINIEFLDVAVFSLYKPDELGVQNKPA